MNKYSGIQKSGTFYAFWGLNRLLKTAELSGQRMSVFSVPRWTILYHERTNITRQLPISIRRKARHEIYKESKTSTSFLGVRHPAILNCWCFIHMSQQAGSVNFGKKGHHKCESNHLKRFLVVAQKYNHQIKTAIDTSPNYLRIMKLPSKFQ